MADLWGRATFLFLQNTSPFGSTKRSLLPITHPLVFILEHPLDILNCVFNTRHVEYPLDILNCVFNTRRKPSRYCVFKTRPLNALQGKPHTKQVRFTVFTKWLLTFSHSAKHAVSVARSNVDEFKHWKKKRVVKACFKRKIKSISVNSGYKS